MKLRRAGLLAPLALLLPLAGCGQELTAGGQRQGDVFTEVTDDPGSPAPNRSPERSSAGGPRLSLATRLALTGTVAVQGNVVLLTPDGRSAALPPGAGVTVALASTDEVVLTQGRVAAVPYDRARITFTRVEASVAEGLVVGGVDVRGTVRVELSQPVVVEAPITLTVLENGAHQLEIDLNSEVWLAAVNPLSRVVPAAAFRAAVTVRTE